MVYIQLWDTLLQLAHLTSPTVSSRCRTTGASTPSIPDARAFSFSASSLSPPVFSLPGCPGEPAPPSFTTSRHCMWVCQRVVCCTPLWLHLISKPNSVIYCKAKLATLSCTSSQGTAVEPEVNVTIGELPATSPQMEEVRKDSQLVEHVTDILTHPTPSDV